MKRDSFEGRRIEVARRILLRLVEILDRHGVIYHLEGGTLLGIVRDGDLLPWDDDIDISIPRDQCGAFLRCIPSLRMQFWHVMTHYFKSGGEAWNEGDIRMFRIRKYLFPFFRSRVSIDVFVKCENRGDVFWQAKKKIMRTSSTFYRSFEEVEFEGRQLKVPNDYRAYMTAKYGDWSIPVKEWNCQNELTVTRDA